MTTSWPTAPYSNSTFEPPAESGADPQQSRRRGLFILVFAAVTVVVTVGAIVLAILAPSFDVSQPQPPSSWSQVYNSDLNEAASGWSTTARCDLGPTGLHASANQPGDTHSVSCGFTPSARRDLLSGGFWLQVTVAPSTQISGTEQPVIRFGDSGFFAVLASGPAAEFVVCDASCMRSETDPQVIESDAWHVEGLSSNTLAVYLPGPGQPVSFYANGQQVATASFQFGAGGRELGLGAPAGGEALYTHMTLFTP